MLSKVFCASIQTLSTSTFASLNVTFTNMVSRISTNSMYFKKDADFFEPSELLFGHPDPMPAKSHSFFLWLAMFNLTIF